MMNDPFENMPVLTPKMLEEQAELVDPEWKLRPPLPGSFGWFALDNDARTRLIPRFMAEVVICQDDYEDIKTKAEIRDLIEFKGILDLSIRINNVMPKGKAMICDSRHYPLLVIDLNG